MPLPLLRRLSVMMESRKTTRRRKKKMDGMDRELDMVLMTGERVLWSERPDPDSHVRNAMKRFWFGFWWMVGTAFNGTFGTVMFGRKKDFEGAPIPEGFIGIRDLDGAVNLLNALRA
jgi:hypothetical protein